MGHCGRLVRFDDAGGARVCRNYPDLRPLNLERTGRASDTYQITEKPSGWKVQVLSDLDHVIHAQS